MVKTILNKIARRPFPTNLKALRNCRISYSQFGEDLYLTTLLGYEKRKGTCIDIGAFRPIEYSNTYIFYQRGWTGVAIDPNPRWASEWLRYRPRDNFVNVAVSPIMRKVGYSMDQSFPACNRVVAEVPANLTNDEKYITVPALPLNEILSDRLLSSSIDLLNIDCEGYDLEILRSLDFKVWHPNVIAAEDTSVGMESDLCVFLEAKSYECMSHIGLTKIFKDRLSPSV